MNDVMRNFGTLRLPDQILFGAGAIEALSGVVRGLGQRAFICSDPFIASTVAFEAAVGQLRDSGITVHVHTGVVPELPVDTVESAVRVAMQFSPDVLIGIGGGSAIDLAKLSALLVSHPGPLSAYYGENKVPSGVRPIIAVPTTSGTGSEVTPVAVASDPDYELKVGISSPYLIPRAALVDPMLTLGMPASVTANSGIDALVHAIESHTAGRRDPAWGDPLPVFMGRNDLSSLLALEAIRLIGGSLRRAVTRPDSRSAREAMSRGSLLAGMAFGTSGTHLSHALQYPIGARSHTPHGLGTGLLLPYVMQACLSETVPQLAAVGAALGISSGSDEEKAQGAVDAVATLVADIGIPTTLAEIGIKREQLSQIADLALGVSRLVGNSSVEVTPELLAAILEAAFTGERASLL